MESKKNSPKNLKSNQPVGSGNQSQQVKKLNLRIDELTEALKRERADATNLRRQYEQQLAGIKVDAKAATIQQLLPVIDNLERSLSFVPKDLEANSYVLGVQKIIKQMSQALEKLGVTRIATIGEVFDPHVHEAISVEEDGDGEEIISEELQSGYQLDKQVIRHAMVRVKRTTKK